MGKLTAEYDGEREVRVRLDAEGWNGARVIGGCLCIMSALTEMVRETHGEEMMRAMLDATRNMIDAGAFELAAVVADGEGRETNA